MKSQLHYLSASHCAAPVTFGLELPVMCTVCAVLPISLTKVKQLRTSTLSYVIATPLPFRVALRRAGDLRFTVAGDVYRLRRTAYIIDQGKTTPHLNLGLCNRNSFRVAGGAYRLRRIAYIIDQGKTTPRLNLGLCNRNSYRVSGGAYRLRRSAYIIDQGKTTPHLNLGLCNHNSITFPRRIAPRR